MTSAEYRAYMKRYYAEHIEYFRWYRKKHRKQAAARKRERYHNDPEYRKKELDRHRKKRSVSLRDTDKSKTT